MLLVRVSPNRIFIINEYWIIVPLIITVEIVIVLKLRNNRAQKHIKSKKLKKELRRRKIFHLANSNIFSSIFIRGGHELVEFLADGFIEVNHENCIIDKGVQFLDNEWLRKLLTIRHSHKIKNGILFITRSALCYVASEAGLGILDTKIINVSSWVTFGKKTLATILTTSPLLFLGIGGTTPITILFSVLTFLSGTGSIISLRESDRLFIKTQAVVGYLSQITQRIQDRTDVVVLDLEPSSDKIIMKRTEVPYECSLPDQILGNQKCVPKIVLNDVKSANVVVDTLIDYDEVVNMQDVTRLSGDIKFADHFETLPIQKPGSIKSEHNRINSGKKFTKTVNFLDKFGDPENIKDIETWETSANTKHDIRTEK